MKRSLRATPRISANKLAEYMQASPRRRKTIIVDQIKPATAVVIRYSDANHALVRFYRDPARTGKNLLVSAADLRDRAATHPDDYASKCLIASARALEAFAPLADRIRPRGLLAVASSTRNSDLVLSGVRVVVAPDVSLIEPGTELRVGAFKFHFPRTSTLRPESLQYVATLLHANLEAAGDAPKKAHCVGVDVFSEKFEPAPRALKERMKNLEAACEEIAERWPTLYDALAEKEAAEGGDG